LSSISSHTGQRGCLRSSHLKRHTVDDIPAKTPPLFSKCHQFLAEMLHQKRLFISTI
jgi:hypothetical protein